MITRARWQLGIVVLCAAASCTDADQVIDYRCGTGTLCLDGGGFSDAKVADAAPPDASLDGSIIACAASQPTIDDDYKFWKNYTGVLADEATFYTELTSGGYRRIHEEGKTVSACSAPLEACGTPAVDRADVATALANADVVAAFAEAGPNLELVFGRAFSFNSDPGLFVVTKGLDKRFGVGEPCLGVANCRAIPAGVSALINLLVQLDVEQGLAGPCADFPPSLPFDPNDAGARNLSLDAGG